MKKKYDMFKIVMTIITMIFIAVMLILNIMDLFEEKKARTENVNVNQVETLK